MAKVVAVKRDGSEIMAYKLDNGEVVDKEKATQMAENKEIENVQVVTSKKGEKFLRSWNDGTTDNNLQNLPTFK